MELRYRGCSQQEDNDGTLHLAYVHVGKVVDLSENSKGVADVAL
jgi:hypothetical protein